jgi:uncharacterized protein
MARPCCKRKTSCCPTCDYFKPAGTPLHALEEVALPSDELEALRLADFEGLYHADAAERMGISRATFGRILEAARRKVVDALLHGKALRIQNEIQESDNNSSQISLDCEEKPTCE